MASRWAPSFAILLCCGCGQPLGLLGQDAGPPDAGDVQQHAGGTPDAGEAPDAGPPPDAGGAPDAGPPDAGTAPDSGEPSDDDGGLEYVIDGGALASLDFGVTGDTRPPIYDITLDYPTQVITTIYQDMAAVSPAIGFVITTGDYMFASPFFGQAAPQAQLYVGAAQAFPGQTYPSMGNHECNYATSSDNCAGETTNPNYNAFLQIILGDLGLPGLGLPSNIPYYMVLFFSSDAANPWTAKFVATAPNAWDDTQDSWLAQVLAFPTTYTFLVRHEPTTNAGGAPGVAPSDLLVASAPLTLKLTGHSHSFSYDPTNQEVINGLGGAQLDTGYTGTFGYVICRQRTDGAEQCSLFDYDTNALSTEPNSVFAVNADGSAAMVQ